MPRLSLLLPLLMLSACGSCVDDGEKPSSTEQSVATPAARGEGGIGGSRFAKPFVPVDPNATPVHREE